MEAKLVWLRISERGIFQIGLRFALGFDRQSLMVTPAGVEPA